MSRAGTSAVFLHLGYPEHPRNFPRLPLRMTIGLPHSSQSMSVATLTCPLPLALVTGFSPVILAIISCDRAAPSFSSGTSASTCFFSSPSNFETLFIPRHFGKLAHPSHGPRLPSRSNSTPPSFSHLIV